MMKMFVLALVAAALIAPSASAQVHVKGYVNKNGTYVAPYYRSSPNSTTLDNYSTKGNVNPYTGKAGTVNPYTPSTLQPTQNNPYGSQSKPPCYAYCPR
jgi:opacity protein-like surface antigen